MDTYSGSVQVVCGDNEFAAHVDLQAERSADGEQESWHGTITVREAPDLRIVRDRREGLLLMPSGREGDFLLNPDVAYSDGSLRIAIRGSGPVPF